LCDIIAGDPVAPRGGADEAPVLVEQGDRDPVHFRFHREEQVRTVGKFSCARQKLAQFVHRIGIVEALHCHDVRGRDKFPEGMTADSLGRRADGRLPREIFFQIRKLAEEGIEFPVGNFRFRLVVIKPVMPENLFPEVVNPRRDILLVFSGHRSSSGAAVRPRCH